MSSAGGVVTYEDEATVLVEAFEVLRPSEPMCCMNEEGAAGGDAGMCEVDGREDESDDGLGVEGISCECESVEADRLAVLRRGLIEEEEEARQERRLLGPDEGPPAEWIVDETPRLSEGILMHSLR